MKKNYLERSIFLCYWGKAQVQSFLVVCVASKGERIVMGYLERINYDKKRKHKSY
jgi:hypothetical protein